MTRSGSNPKCLLLLIKAPPAILAILIITISFSNRLLAEAASCAEHSWFTVDHQHIRSDATELCNGLLDASFDRRENAFRRLRHVIKESPHGHQAYEAHEALLSLFFRAGQYREALDEADAMLRIRPNAKDVADLRPLLLSLGRYPDATITRAKSVLPPVSISDSNPHLPVTADGHKAVAFMDTGANISVISDLEAQALGLQVDQVSTKMGDVNGERSVPIRVTHVHDLLIGRNHLHHVSFVVLSAKQPPFDTLPPSQHLVVGIQVLRALGNIAIDRSGRIILAGRSHTRAPGIPIAFNQSQPVLQMRFHGIPLNYTIDTGATHTSLNPLFAARFPNTLRAGKQLDRNITGFAGSKTQSTVQIDNLSFELGSATVCLSPATILLKNLTNASSWAAGNLGYDLVQQLTPLVLDFDQMKLFVQQKTRVSTHKASHMPSPDVPGFVESPSRDLCGHAT